MRKFLLQYVLKTIEKATDTEITRVIQAVVKRSRNLYPGEEIVFLSLPMEEGERRQVLEAALEALSKTQP